MNRGERFRDPPRLRRYVVKDIHGVGHDIVAHYCFNNEGEGLIFRRYIDDNVEDRTRVVASFAHGFWQFYAEQESAGG